MSMIKACVLKDVSQRAKHETTKDLWPKHLLIISLYLQEKYLYTLASTQMSQTYLNEQTKLKLIQTLIS